MVTWQCSRDAMKEAIAVMDDIDIDDLESPSELLRSATIIAIVYVCAIGFPVFFIMCIVIKCRTHWCLRVLFFITLFIEFCLSLTCMIIAFVAQGKYGDRSNALKKLDDIVHGCMDSYSDIPDGVIEDQLEKPI